MAASALEKQLRLIRERLDSIEDALAEEMSDEDKKGRAEALREHKEAKTIPFIRKAGIEGLSVDASKEEPRQRALRIEGSTRLKSPN